MALGIFISYPVLISLILWNSRELHMRTKRPNDRIDQLEARLDARTDSDHLAELAAG
jgi:hypothetical protein